MLRIEAMLHEKTEKKDRFQKFMGSRAELDSEDED
jgi:hypothetical protein